MSEQSAKTMVAANGTIIGKHQTKSFAFDMVSGLEALLIPYGIGIGTIAGISGSFTAFLFVMACAAMILWRIARVRMHLQRKIARMEAKEPRPNETDRLIEVDRSKHWYAAIGGLAYPTFLICGALNIFTSFAPLLLVAISFWTKKELVEQVVNYIEWYDKQQKNKEREDSIDKEWIDFGKWMLDNKIARQTPAGFIETYEKYRVQKETPCTACSCVKTQTSPQ